MFINTEYMHDERRLPVRKTLLALFVVQKLLQQRLYAIVTFKCNQINIIKYT